MIQTLTLNEKKLCFFDTSCVFMQVKFGVDFLFKPRSFLGITEFEERSDDTANLPLTLNGSSHRALGGIKFLNEQAYLLLLFIQKLSVKIDDTAPFLTLMDLILTY